MPGKPVAPLLPRSPNDRSTFIPTTPDAAQEVSKRWIRSCRHFGQHRWYRLFRRPRICAFQNPSLPWRLEFFLKLSPANNFSNHIRYRRCDIHRHVHRWTETQLELLPRPQRMKRFHGTGDFAQLPSNPQVSRSTSAIHRQAFCRTQVQRIFRVGIGNMNTEYSMWVLVSVTVLIVVAILFFRRPPALRALTHGCEIPRLPGGRLDLSGTLNSSCHCRVNSPLIRMLN
jgi:hypothetical protein